MAKQVTAYERVYSEPPSVISVSLAVDSTVVDSTVEDSTVEDSTVEFKSALFRLLKQPSSVDAQTGSFVVEIPLIKIGTATHLKELLKSRSFSQINFVRKLTVAQLLIRK